jgi:hypothetical protein
VASDNRHFGKMKELDGFPFHAATLSEFIDSIIPEVLKGLKEKE